jgi:hypothetical protein
MFGSGVFSLFLENNVVFEILWYFLNIVFARFLKNSVFKIAVFAMLHYFHGFRNLAPDQRF